MRRQVLESFRNHFPGNEIIASSFADICTYHRYSKNHMIKPLGGVERSIHIVLEGSAGVFTSSEKREVCLDLSLPGDFLLEYESFVTGDPSEGYTRALEPPIGSAAPVDRQELSYREFSATFWHAL